MSCRGEVLESFVRAELPRGEAAAVAEHLRGCDGCAREVAWLRAERQAMAARLRDDPPALKMVELRGRIERRLESERELVMRRRRRARAYRVARGAASAVGAALLALLVASIGASDEAMASAGSSCVSAEWVGFCAGPTEPEELVAVVEDQFNACLVASPLLGPGASALCR